ncbi:SocA family protein [Methylobacterium sp. E-005]|uniref:Panacea domain-containing protein n=1 Tax=Methylobacterium sp. E-005 TaxID=2836549 RepID=UPI001FBA7362|nr:Panacea domain-containing protein [Methylobacterium sp. E-005]MCJ2088802.1 SocA family protein [Methylobacterium sp. E-005]
MINAIIFFVGNTRNLAKIKLFKLLYFLDFEHYKQTGRSVTGLDYSAWKMGPVPKDLFDEIECPSDDLAAAIKFGEKYISFDRPPMLVITPLKEFSSEHFTKREMRLLRDLSKEYYNARADEMIEATHLENMPWDQVYNKQNKPLHGIPYSLAIRKDEADRMSKVAEERDELMRALG